MPNYFPPIRTRSFLCPSQSLTPLPHLSVEDLCSNERKTKTDAPRPNQRVMPTIILELGKHQFSQPSGYLFQGSRPYGLCGYFGQGPSTLPYFLFSSSFFSRKKWDREWHERRPMHTPHTGSSSSLFGCQSTVVTLPKVIYEVSSFIFLFLLFCLGRKGQAMSDCCPSLNALSFFLGYE